MLETHLTNPLLDDDVELAEHLLSMLALLLALKEVEGRQHGDQLLARRKVLGRRRVARDRLRDAENLLLAAAHAKIDSDTGPRSGGARAREYRRSACV